MKYHLKRKYRLKANSFIVMQFKIWCSVLLVIAGSSYMLKNAYAVDETHWKIGVTGEEDSVVADYDYATTTLTISGTGTMKEIYSNGKVPWYKHYNSITRVEIKDNVTATSLCRMFFNLTKLTAIKGLDKLSTSQVADMNSMFKGCQALEALDVSTFDTSRVTDMSSMFDSCRALKELDVSTFDTSQVTNMSMMFYDCQLLTTLDLSCFDTSKVTDVSYMFDNCLALKELNVSTFDTSQVTDMSRMFNSCQTLEELDVSTFYTGQVTNMSSMFDNCQTLEELDVSHFDTSKVTNMNSMFSNCQSLTKLDISQFDTSQVTDMKAMFAFCKKIIELDVSSFNVEKVENMSGMFESCYLLKEIDLFSFDKSKNKEFSAMFEDCQSLVRIKGLVFSNVNSATPYIFGNTPNLSQIQVKTAKELDVPVDADHLWIDENGNPLTLDGNNAIIPVSDEYKTYTLTPAITHNITYRLDGGTLESKQDKFEILEGYELPVPTKNGYIFDGWYDSEAFDKKMTKIEKYTLEDKTVYAKWIKKAELQANNFNVKLSSETYTGNEITYTITSLLEGIGTPQVKKIEKNGVEVSKVKEAGTYKMTFDVAEGNIYLGAKGLTLEFTIKEKPSDPIVKPDKTTPNNSKPTIPEIKPQETTDVKTGDNSSIILYSGMILVGLAVMTCFKRKKE